MGTKISTIYTHISTHTHTHTHSQIPLSWTAQPAREVSSRQFALNCQPNQSKPPPRPRRLPPCPAKSAWNAEKGSVRAVELAMRRSERTHTHTHTHTHTKCRERISASRRASKVKEWMRAHTHTKLAQSIHAIITTTHTYIHVHSAKVISPHKHRLAQSGGHLLGVQWVGAPVNTRSTGLPYKGVRFGVAGCPPLYAPHV
jgi:hypothetical protein